MIINLSRCIEIVDAVQDLGGKVPAELRNTVDAMAVVRSELQAADPAAVVLAALDRGKPITAAVAAEACRAQAVADGAEMTQRRVDSALGQRFAEAMMGEAGEQLIDSLRPSFDAAAQGIASLAYAVGASADSLIEAGPDAIASWKAAGQHRQVLDNIVARVLIPLYMDVGIPGQGGQFPNGQLQPFATACWLDDGKIYRETLELFSARSDKGDPAGRWHALGGTLQLHSPAEVQERFNESIGNILIGPGGFREIGPRGRVAQTPISAGTGLVR